MAAYVVFHQTILDGEKFGEYAEKARPTLGMYGGEMMAIGAVADVLEGDHDQKVFAIAKFPDVETAKKWYRSSEYGKFAPMRHESAEGFVVLFDELTM